MRDPNDVSFRGVRGLDLSWSRDAVHAPAYFGAAGYPNKAARPFLRQAIDAFGAERIMWASDVTSNQSWEAATGSGSKNQNMDIADAPMAARLDSLLKISRSGAMRARRIATRGDRMLSYATVGSNSLDSAKAFYDQLLPLAGMKPLLEHGSGGRIYASPDRRMFGVLGPFDGGPASVGNGSMFGFLFDSRGQVRAFHAKALELGGTCDGEPGFRGPPKAGNYAAYFRDLDGNKFCAFTMGGE